MIFVHAGHPYARAGLLHETIVLMERLVEYVAEGVSGLNGVTSSGGVERTSLTGTLTDKEEKVEGSLFDAFLNMASIILVISVMMFTLG